MSSNISVMRVCSFLILVLVACSTIDPSTDILIPESVSIQKLTMNPPISRSRFGNSVALDGNIMVVGASNASSSDIPRRGLAYVYQRDSKGQWQQIKEVRASDGKPNDHFGASVAISGSTIVIGAPNEVTFDPFVPPSKGAVYIFEKDLGGANNWGEAKKLTGSDSQDNDLFGFAVDIEKDMIAIGAPSHGDLILEQGTVYVFARHRDKGNPWKQVEKIVADFPNVGDQFGSSVAITKKLIVVGAPADSLGMGVGFSLGAAYVFERSRFNKENWEQVGKLTASDPVIGGAFGSSVDSEGNRVLIGSPGSFAQQIPGVGAVYSFERSRDSSQEWKEVSKTVADDGKAYDQFGSSIAVQGNYMVVGASAGDGDFYENQGSVYVFLRKSGQKNKWKQVDKLIADDGEIGDSFGRGVSLSGKTIIIGADRNTISGQFGFDHGAAYVFTRP
jgi:hypothetical protein